MSGAVEPVEGLELAEGGQLAAGVEELELAAV
jgi:hypothetical protein